MNIHKPSIITKEGVSEHNRKQEIPPEIIKQVVDKLQEAAEEVAERLVEEDLLEETQIPCLAAVQLILEGDFFEMEYVFTDRNGERLREIDIEEYDGFDDIGDIVEDCEIPDEFDWVFLNPDVFPQYAEMYHSVGEKRNRSDDESDPIK